MWHILENLVMSDFSFWRCTGSVLNKWDKGIFQPLSYGQPSSPKVCLPTDLFQFLGLDRQLPFWGNRFEGETGFLLRGAGWDPGTKSSPLVCVLTIAVNLREETLSGCLKGCFSPKACLMTDLTLGLCPHRSKRSLFLLFSQGLSPDRSFPISWFRPTTALLGETGLR